MTNRVLIMAGGTGGHVFPALALAKKLRELGLEVHWLGVDKAIEARLVPAAGIPIHYIPIQSLRGKGIKRWLTMPFTLARAVYCSIKVIRKLKPKLVIGMGGFVSGPGALAAKMLGIPLVIHEQNALAGMTNRYLGKIADRVLCAFPGAFPVSKKMQVTGNPVRDDLIALRHKPISDQGPLHVLVIGGSLGAVVFNEVIPKALALMPKENRPLVWQQTGEKTFQFATEQYANSQVEAKVVAFIDNMAEAYAWADMVVCRAGAMTVSELAVVGIPAILVPLPYAVDDHQRYNAKYLSDNKAAILLLQSEFSAQSLASLLQFYSINRQELKEMAVCARGLAHADATGVVAKACIDLMEKTH
ncbi:MAG: undecaprenyldiphospho-muramoylpentapeptide beta-N-acetylglucosaminyltransferase [Gammaproteobacteria bacterium]|nr:undecaprenyldiphospho-muramoylpentapeptide beta-N-acetylglucosaminyltransferase [Gammaproteobacteria bacterium]